MMRNYFILFNQPFVSSNLTRINQKHCCRRGRSLSDGSQIWNNATSSTPTHRGLETTIENGGDEWFSRDVGRFPSFLTRCGGVAANFYWHLFDSHTIATIVLYFNTLIDRQWHDIQQRKVNIMIVSIGRG
jgi:hypothetical protein